MKRHRMRARSALTLLEVVLALAILAGSFATLAQLVGLGIRAAAASRELTQGQLLAESVMSEMAAGVFPVQNLSQAPIETHPGWLVSALIDNAPQQGMLHVTVLVQRESTRQNATYYELSRWMRDPNLAYPVDDQATDDGGASSTSNSSNNSGNGGNNNNASGGANRNNRGNNATGNRSPGQTRSTGPAGPNPPTTAPGGAGARPGGTGR